MSLPIGRVIMVGAAIAKSIQRMELMYEYQLIRSWPQDDWTRRRLSFIEDQLWPKIPHLAEERGVRKLTTL